jgi:membrane associated rhomboid family serine protease
MTQGPWSAPGDPAEPAQALSEPPPAAEPAFNARLTQSWALMLILLLTGVGYAVQLYLRHGLGEPRLEALGALSRGTLEAGWWWTPLSSMFLHANLLHLLMNLSALLPFGLILSRRFGPGARGQLPFLGYYLLCGLAGSAAYVALQPDPMALAVGASGAIFGLWGGVLRLSRRGEALPAFSPRVLKQFAGPVIANVAVIALFGLSGGGIAWQAHLGGFLFGWLTLGVFVPRRQP